MSLFKHLQKEVKIKVENKKKTKIEYINYQIYLNWFDTFSKEFPVHKVIYVKTDADTCYGRIAKRSRDGEANIPLSYLENCSLYHDNMLDEFMNKRICTNQLILNGNVDIYQNKNQLEIWNSKSTTRKE